MAKVSINLVTWNGEKYISECLRSIAQQTFQDFSLLIIDNGSVDPTVEIISEQYPQLKVLRYRENIGFVKAHNQAIHWTKSDYVLMLNQDVVLAPDFLASLVEFMDNHPLAGAVTGKILRWQEGQKTNYIDSLGLEIYKSYRLTDRKTGEVDAGQYDLVEEVFGVSGVGPFYRRKALEEVMYQKEYFDESFFSYKEDVDLAHRLRWAGWSAWYVPMAVAYHDRSVTCPQEKMSKWKVARHYRHKPRQFNYYSYRNHLYFLYKNLPHFNWRFFAPVLWYEAIKFFYNLAVAQRNLKAWREFFKNRARLKLKRQVIMKTAKISGEDIARWLR